MGIEQITVSAGGNTFAGIAVFEADAGFDMAARSFHFEVAPSAALLQTFAPGTAITCAANGDVLCAGYVDRLRPSYKKLSVSGRATAQDFVDCAAMDQAGTGRFASQSLLQIAQALAQKFNVTIAADQQLPAIETYQITPGEKAFAAIEKLAREQGLTLCGQADGSILITKPGNKRQAGSLTEGMNIKLGAEADLNWAHRHSPIIVRGQAADGFDDQSLQVTATASDSSVTRYRPLVVIEDRAVDQNAAQALADTRCQREAGESLRATIPVQGFHDSGGQLWTPGFLVWIESPLLGLTQALLIRRAKFKKSVRRGSETILELVDPRAYGGVAAKGNKTGTSDVWGVGAAPVPYLGSVVVG